MARRQASADWALQRKKVFAIVAQQRSGTHLLSSLLSSHSAIGGGGEVFHHRASTNNFYDYWGRRVAEEPDAIRPARYAEIWKSFAGQLLDKTGKKFVGIIVMYNQLGALPPRLARAALFDRPVIHLVRRNVLRTHVSDFVNRVRAAPTHSRQASVAPAKVELPLEHLVEDLRERVATIEDMRGRLRDHPATLEVTYEHLVQARSDAIAEILASLRLPHEDLTTSLEMTNPWPLNELLVNYDDVARLLGPTEFAWTLS